MARPLKLQLWRKKHGLHLQNADSRAKFLCQILGGNLFVESSSFVTRLRLKITAKLIEFDIGHAVVHYMQCISC